MYLVDLSVSDGDGGVDSASTSVEVSPRTVWYVDDDAAGNPAHTVSPEFPFDVIQEGIDAAASGHTVQVAAGTYPGNLTWTAKSLQLLGAGAASTIVDARGLGRCLSITNVPDTAVVDGFTFTGGSASSGGGLYVGSSSLRIQNSAIVHNVGEAKGGGIFLSSSAAVIVNNTISGNNGGIRGYSWDGGGGIYADFSSPVIANNIITANNASRLLSAGRERDFRRIILGLAEAHVHRLTRGVAPFGLSRQQFDTPG